MSQPAPPKPRIVSLDQFRGYTIAGMFLVNFVGGFTVSPYLWKHHNTFCSYADTIMPHFLFAVGFGFRLSFGRRALTQGTHAAMLRVVRRLIGLALVGLFIYQMDDRLLPTYWIDLAQRGAWNEIWRPFEKDWTQTLFHIAMTTLWILPVIRAGARWRIVYMVASALLHVALNDAFYFEWLYAPPVPGHTGGPLGCLTWSIPALAGTLACDAIADTPRPRLGRIFAGGAVLMLLGYALSCGTRFYDVPPQQAAALESVAVSPRPVVPDAAARAAWNEKRARGEWRDLLAEPPFVPPPSTRDRKINYWMMSVKSAALSFMMFNAGFSLFVYGLFSVACDLGGWQLGLFRTLGRNALAGYLIQWPTDSIFTQLVEDLSKRWGTALGYPADAVGRSAPASFVIVAFVLFFAVNWLILWWMERRNIFLKV